MIALSITNLHKTYDAGPPALAGIDLSVEEGDFFALLGPNGAGKTTIIGIVTTLIKRNSGKIEIFGYDLDDKPALTKSMIGCVPQEFNFNIFERVNQIVLQQAGYYGLTRAEAKDVAEFYLNKLELWDKRDNQAMTLSGGMKRRLMIARALVHNPRLLFLDEPTAGVDIELRRSMWDFIIELNEKGTTIILTTHYLEEAENLCRNIAIIDHGKIIENTSMKKLLETLDSQTLVLEFSEVLKTEPVLEPFQVIQKDKNTIEVTVNKGNSINRLFSLLNALDLEVSNIKNKTNRLEELFVGLLDKNSK